MSLNCEAVLMAGSDEGEAGGTTSTLGPVKNIKPLRTADQYELWQARVTDACYGVAGRDIFTLSASDVKVAIDDVTKTKNEWLPKCWTLLRNSLHDELFVKVKHVSRGMIPELLAEIRTALLVDSADEIQPLKVELYSATMRSCGNDLQTYIAYFKQRLGKLKFHKADLSDEEAAPLFLKGLSDTFSPIVNAYSMPGCSPKDLDKLIEHVRKYASMPNISDQLLKARSAAATAKIFTSVSNNNISRSEIMKVCKQFSRRGACNYGDRCKFSHPQVPAREEQKKLNITRASVTPGNPAKNGEEKKCGYCSKPGHSEVECRKKQREAALVQSVVLALNGGDAVSKPSFASRPPDEEAYDSSPYTLVFALQNSVVSDVKGQGWVVDSGATSCATYDASDCRDIRDCNIIVTAAGTSFKVKQIGTAMLRVKGDSGKVNVITIANCLISPQFPATCEDCSLFNPLLTRATKLL